MLLSAPSSNIAVKDKVCTEKRALFTPGSKEESVAGSVQSCAIASLDLGCSRECMLQTARTASPTYLSWGHT